MSTSATNVRQLVQTFKRFTRRLLIIGGNRFELLMLEVQEERECLLHAILLAFSVATLALLAGVAFTGAIVVLFWPHSPLGALLFLAALYGATAFWLYRRLTRMLREWKNLPATLDQLQKDRACLEKNLT